MSPLDERAAKVLETLLKLAITPADTAAFDELTDQIQQARPDFTREYAQAQARKIMEDE